MRFFFFLEKKTNWFPLFLLDLKRYSLCSQPLSTRLESVRLTLFLDFAGRLVFLGKGANDQQASSLELKGLGYY